MSKVEEFALKHFPEMWRYPKGKPVDYMRPSREHAKAAITEALEWAAQVADDEAAVAKSNGWTEAQRMGSNLGVLIRGGTSNA